MWQLSAIFLRIGGCQCVTRVLEIIDNTSKLCTKELPEIARPINYHVAGKFGRGFNPLHAEFLLRAVVPVAKLKWLFM